MRINIKSHLIPKLTTRQTLLYGFGALFALFVLLGAANLRHMLGMRADLAELADLSLAKVGVVMRLDGLIDAQNLKMGEAFLHGEVSERLAHAQDIRDLTLQIEEMRQALTRFGASPAELALLEQDRALAREVLAVYAGADTGTFADKPDELNPDYLSSGYELYDHVIRPKQQRRLDIVRKLQSMQEAVVRSDVERVQTREERDHYLQIGLGFLGLLGGTVIVICIARRVVNTESSLVLEKEQAVVTLNSLAEAVIATDSRGIVTRVNPAAERLLELEAAQILGQPLAAVAETVLSDGRSVSEVVDELARGERESFASDAISLIAGRGTISDVAASITGIRDARGRVLGVIVALQDITEAKAASRVLERQARHDQLTGLLNRYAFETHVRDKLDAAPTKPHTLCFIDLDQFKLVNDTCGHAAGDEMLRRISEWLKNAIRKDDILARMGGDEFAVLLSECSPEYAQKVCEGILDRIRQFRFDWDDKLFTVSASIGGVEVAPGGDFSQWLRNADTACIMAKDLGRDRVLIHRNGDMDVPQRHEEMDWVRRIRDALAHDRFCLYAQKIAPLHRGDSTHWEILVRMRGENGDLVPPMAFIPAAERYNLMPLLDQWVVDAAFRAIAAAASAAGEVYSINLSGRSLGEESFARFVLERVNHYGIDLAKICFEITETAAIADVNHATMFMRVLRERNCRFALDDFGNGLSSFGYLKDLPIDYLKIDGQFIRGLGSDPVCLSIVEAISKIAHATDLKTVAEFVDSEATVTTLRTLGIDFVQGYHIGEPVPLGAILPPAEAQRVA